MRLGVLICAGFSGALALGCLTTPASETGFTARVRHLTPKACGPGALIEDAEDGDTRIVVQNGRGGYWYTFVDPEGSTVLPQPFKMSEPGRSNSKHAAHMFGLTAGSGPSIYAGIAFAFSDPHAPFDASRYSGISFWAKGPAHIRFEVPDGDTTPEGAVCKDCYNDFGIELAFTDKWERYTIPFEWLAQRSGWGEPFPTIARDRLYAMEWQFGTPARNYDVWIDDITFVCGTEGER
jgi:endoglucanase